LLDGNRTSDDAVDVVLRVKKINSDAKLVFVSTVVHNVHFMMIFTNIQYGIYVADYSIHSHAMSNCHKILVNFQCAISTDKTIGTVRASAVAKFREC